MTAGGIALDGLTVAYDRRAALRDVTGSFAAGSMTAICGPNGAGKSSLVKAIVGLLRPAAGRVLRAGIERRNLAYLPQAAEIDRSFPITIRDLVLLGAWGRTGAFAAASAAALRTAEAALDGVGLSGFGPRAIESLSSGQFQRVLFARLLLQDARVIVLDEPFTGVDARTSRDLLALIRRWHGERRTIIAVLHDLDLVRENFPETLLLARDPIAWGETAAVLSHDNLGKARAFADHWTDVAARDLAA